MNKIKFLFFPAVLLPFFLALFTFSADVYAQKESDRIIAIVGNDVILESDLNYQIMLYARQNNVQQLNDQLIQQVFQNLLTEKILLAKADQDSILISEDELQKQLDYRIQTLSQQFGSEKNLEDAYGLTVSKIKSVLKEDIRKKMKVDRLKQQKFGSDVNVSKAEVLKFYSQFRDSIPIIPESYELYQVVRTPELTQEAKRIARERALQLLDSVKAGMDFSELARKYSDDSASAVLGGDLGKSKKGSFVKEFEDAAFILKPGEVSDLVETEFGYHIIKVNEKTGDVIRAQHILVKYPHLESADFESINFLKDLRTKIESGQLTFKQAAVQFSQESKSAADSGYIGTVPLNGLSSDEAAAIKDLSAGGISDPVRAGDTRNYAYYMYMVKNRIPEHRITAESDYPILEKYAQNYKEQKSMSEWIEEIKKSVYVEIKI